MKKIVKIIVFIIVAALLLTLISSIPAFDDIKLDIKDKLNISNSSDDSFYERYENGVFYLSSGDKMNSYTNISDIPDDLRGFFIKDDIVLFAIKVSGSDDRALTIEEEDLTYGGYEYCYFVTYDMVTFVNYSDSFSATINGDALIVYYATDNIEENQIAKLNDNLLANQPINIGYNDPPEIEGPGAS